MKRHGLIFIMLFFLVFLLSCAMDKERITLRGPVVKMVSDNNLSLSIQYFPKNELIKSFGKVNNPFVSPVSFLESNNLMAFKLKVKNKSYNNVVLYLNRIELQFVGINAKPFNRFQLANFWEYRLAKQSEYKNWNMSILKQVIKKNVFKNKFFIKRGEESEGFIVFKGAFPDYGKAIIYVPIFDDSGNMLNRHKIEFEF